MIDQQVSIIIPHRNQFGRLINCLERLMELRYHSHEIIVVDNGSEGSLDFLKNYPVQLLYANGSPSPYSARNIGIAHAHSKIIVLLDVNAVVESGWLEVAVDLLRPDMIIGGIPLKPEPAELDVWQRFDYLYSVIDPSELGDLPLKALPATNLFFYKSVWEELGPFPEVRSLGDMAWTTKAGKAGYELLVDPRIGYYYPFKSRKDFSAKFRRLGGGKIENQFVQSPIYYVLKNFLPPSPSFVNRMWTKNHRGKMGLSIFQIIGLCYWVKINYGIGAMRRLMSGRF